MAKTAARKDLCSIRQVAHGLDYQGWMDLAQSVRTMLAGQDDKCVDLSADNILYDKKTKRCHLADAKEVKHEGDPIKFRWYPQHIWNAWDEMFYYYDRIAALVVLELMYGTSPFYDTDEEVFRNNVRERNRTVCPTNCKNFVEKSPAVDFTNYGTCKAIWMLTYTFRGAARLNAGLGYLKICKNRNRESERHVIENWDYLSDHWERAAGECKPATTLSLLSPSNTGSSQPRSDSNEDEYEDQYEDELGSEPSEENSNYCNELGLFSWE